LRIVRRIAKEAGKQQQAPQSKRSLHLSVQATSVEAVGEEDARTLAQLDGKFVETGMLGTTQSFGAIAVLEGKGGWTAAMAASLIATLQVEAFTLSRLDLGKISLEDREAMLENARVVERNIVPPDAETARHFREASAWAAVKGGLIRRSIINRQCWRESVCGHFSHGVSSGSVKCTPLPPCAPQFTSEKPKQGVTVARSTRIQTGRNCLRGSWHWRTAQLPRSTRSTRSAPSSWGFTDCRRWRASLASAAAMVLNCKREVMRPLTALRHTSVLCESERCVGVREVFE